MGRAGSALGAASRVVPTPFSIFEVDKVQIPEKIVRKGPLAIDALIDDFLAGEFRRPSRRCT